MREFWQFVGGFLVISVICLGLGWAFTGNDFFLYKYFAPKQEAVRREVFKQSQAYNDGMVNDLQSLRLSYVSTSDPAAKEAIASVVLQRSGSFNGDMPPDLRDFIDKLKADKGL